MSTTKTCEKCRHHHVQMRPKPLDEALGHLVLISDNDEPFYHCRAPEGPQAGQPVGFAPISCPAFEAPPSAHSTMSDADRLYRQWQDRMGRRGELE
jgi:hypothetical protein